MAAFCTLFDSNYLDKGIALYESLNKVTTSFTLYVFAFNQQALHILVDLNLSNMIVVSLKDFETERLLRLKKERSPAEYCWTCTPAIIDYVLTNFNEPQCTYVDADLYFFSSPDILLQEIENTTNSVIITEHRFPPWTRDKMLKMSGKYCVQFNTFTNNTNGRKILVWWKEQCLENCHYTRTGEIKGDQKYLEGWTKDFEGVHELQNLGGGVAPWNIDQYNLTDPETFQFSFNNTTFKLVFYHFQNIRYLPFGFVNIKSGTNDKRVGEFIYKPYLSHIEKIRKMLLIKYGVKFSIKKGYFKNPVLKFIQNYIMPFKVQYISHLLSLRKLRREK